MWFKGAGLAPIHEITGFSLFSCDMLAEGPRRSRSLVNNWLIVRIIAVASYHEGRENKCYVDVSWTVDNLS
jgi:hypothetical protein